MEIKPSTRKNKRLMAVFSNGKTIHFGNLGSQTYIDHHDIDKQRNYIKRHQPNEDFENPYSAGALSRWILWGDSRNIDKNIRNFKKKFNIV
jgi:hypothetical protein